MNIGKHSRKKTITHKYLLFILLFSTFNALSSEWYSLEGKGACVSFQKIAQHVPEFKQSKTPQDVYQNYKKHNKETKLIDYSTLIKKYKEFKNGDFNPPAGAAYLLAINDRSFWILIKKNQCKTFQK